MQRQPVSELLIITALHCLQRSYLVTYMLTHVHAYVCMCVHGSYASLTSVVQVHDHAQLRVLSCIFVAFLRILAGKRLLTKQVSITSNQLATLSTKIAIRLRQCFGFAAVLILVGMSCFLFYCSLLELRAASFFQVSPRTWHAFSSATLLAKK